MNDNKNQNQPNPAASDYQKILDEYAASVKPGDADPEVEVKKPEIDLNITTSLKEAPVKPEENKIPEIKPDITEIIPSKPAETFLKSVNSPQLESPIHPSLAANLEGDDIPEKPIISSQPSEKIDKIVPPVIETEVKKPMENISNSVKTPIIEPPLPTSEISPPQKTPEEVKAEINRLLEDDDQSQTSSDSITPKTGSNMGKIFFIFALILFLAVAAGLAYFLFLIPSNSSNSNNSFNSVTPIITKTEDNTGSNTTGSGTCELNDKTYQVGESFASADGCNTCNCSSAGVITCTEKACADTSTVTSATKSATVTSTTKTAFQKMIANFTLYKDITSDERLMFTKEGNYWPSFTKSSDKLYSFVQKLIKGSIKTLVIDHNNLKSILTSEDFKNGYDYTFYLTPNYESWTSSEFKTLDYKDTGIGDFTPLYAYSDKLIWTTRNNCGGARSEDIESQKVQDQCNSLVQEIETAFP